MSELRFNRIKHPEGATRKGPKNANVQYFTGTENERVDTLIRETIQNPLDHILDKSKPVIIDFEEIQIPAREIPEIQEIRKTVDALILELHKLKKTEGGQIDDILAYYKKARERLSETLILSLKISDYNTKGLTGSKKDNTSNLGRFLGGTGYFDDASTGGGSGGLGKFAPFKFSAINFCFYSSYNIEEEYIYYGWGNNFYHIIGENEYLGETNIGSQDDVLKLKTPYENGFLSKRIAKGTDVFVIGHQDNFNTPWNNLVTTSVIRNFFASIIDGMLIVNIKNLSGDKICIDSKTIFDNLHLFQKNKRRSEFKDITADAIILECIEAYKKGEKFNSLKTEINTPILGECEIRIYRDDDYSKYFTFIRGPKMLIFTKKIGYGDLPYSGVFCCKSERGNKLLRNIEDSHHRNWPFERGGQSSKINKEINQFMKHCINLVASHDSDDSFGLSGLSLFSLGNSKQSKTGSETYSITESETSIIYPKNSFSNNTPTNFKYGGVVVVDKKGRRKKIEPKKPDYKKPEESKATQNKKETKRQYRVSDFKAQIFKNDAVKCEYHLFIESDKNTNIKNILFSIPGADGVAFIDFIYDQNDRRIEPDKNFKESENAFEKFELIKGLNLFKVHTKFNNKVEILIK